MSMPSSRLHVATRPRSSPRFSWSSITTRCSRASDPWWAFTSSPASAGYDALALGQLVEAGGEALGRPAGVAEDDRRAVGEDQLEDAGVDAGPDARAGTVEAIADVAGPRRRLGRRDRLLAEVAHVLDRDDDVDLERLADAGVDDA